MTALSNKAQAKRRGPGDDDDDDKKKTDTQPEEGAGAMAGDYNLGEEGERFGEGRPAEEKER